MKWPWRRKPIQPEIPAYKTPVIDSPSRSSRKILRMWSKKKEMTETGMWRIFPSTKKDPKGMTFDIRRSFTPASRTPIPARHLEAGRSCIESTSLCSVSFNLCFVTSYTAGAKS